MTRPASTRATDATVYVDQGLVDPNTQPDSVDHAAKGRFDLGALTTDHIGLDGINDAFARMELGQGARMLVVP